MTTVFRLDASIRGNKSVTRSIANTLESAITADRDGIEVVRRDVAANPIDPRLWALTQGEPMVPDVENHPDRDDAVRTATELADEMAAAQAYVIAAPFYNYGVSQHVKAWVDLLFSDPRFQPGQETIAGRPAYVVIARGGGYAPGTPKHGWDHGTDWLRRIFGDVLGLDLQLIETELTLAPIMPGMEDLRSLAEDNLNAAHDRARTFGNGLAQRLLTAA